MKRLLIERGCWIALVGAVFATAGDFGQLWVVNAGRPEFLLATPPSNLIVFATLAGSLGIPLYGLGYYVRARQAYAQKPNEASWLVLAGVSFAVLGGLVHSATGITVANEIGEIASGLSPIEGIMAAGPIVVSLWGLASVFLFAAGIFEASLPQELSDRVFNPFLLTLLFTVIAAGLTPPWNDFVGPAAVNIAHILFFARWARVQRN